MDLHFERIDFGSKIINSLLVDIHLNSILLSAVLVFVLGSFLLVEEERVLRFDVGDFIIQSEEIVFEIFEFEELFFEGGDHCVFMC